VILTDGRHVISDESPDELHRFAASIGLKREWHQGDHYDLTARRMLQKATRRGARTVSPREIVNVLRRQRQGARA